MPVPISPPVSIPEAPAVLLTKFFYTDFEVHFKPDGSDNRLSFKLVPADDGNNLYENHVLAKTFYIPFTEAAQHVPEAAAAIAACLAAFPKVEEYLSL